MSAIETAVDQIANMISDADVPSYQKADARSRAKAQIRGYLGPALTLESERDAYKQIAERQAGEIIALRNDLALAHAAVQGNPTMGLQALAQDLGQVIDSLLRRVEALPAGTLPAPANLPARWPLPPGGDVEALVQDIFNTYIRIDPVGHTAKKDFAAVCSLPHGEIDAEWQFVGPRPEVTQVAISHIRAVHIAPAGS